MHTAQHWSEFGLAQAPGLIRLVLEWRVAWEYGAALLAQPWLTTAAAGDGHPVLVFPGMLASDVSTGPLRRYLGRLGYECHGWGQGNNLGPRHGVLDACRDRLHDVHRRNKRKVSLIGWSLGGIYARELAKEFPRQVRLVITLGSPFTGHPKATNAWRVYELVTGHRIGAADLHAPLRKPPPLPTTSIYSRSDGVVAWQCCVEQAGAMAENIEVESSHLGLGLNPLAWYAIADRLAQPLGRWKPFARGPGARAWLYRDPARRGLF
jgi:pimeloyl-ACP methyl ester carboxylesterase